MSRGYQQNTEGDWIIFDDDFPTPDIDLRDCAFCKCKTWHEKGVCEWADSHHRAARDDQQTQRSGETK